MDPQLRSFLTTILAVALGAVATWLVKAGIITADQTGSFVEGAIGVILALGAAGVAWWKTRSHTPDAQVKAIEKMDTTTANAAVAALPTTAKNQIKIATMSDEALVNAVAAMPDVTKIEVRKDAVDGVATAAADKSQPKVITEGTKT